MPTVPDPRKAREKSGKTQLAVANEAGVSLSTVCRCERERAWPRVRQVRRAYAEALDVDLVALEESLK